MITNEAVGAVTWDDEVSLSIQVSILSAWTLSWSLMNVESSYWWGHQRAFSRKSVAYVPAKNKIVPVCLSYASPRPLKHPV